MGPTPRANPQAPSAATEVELIPVLEDNYVFVLHGGRGSRAAVVDPAVADPVIAWLRERDLELVAVLQTHHHSDHIGGTPGLLAVWPEAEVIAAADDRERIPLQTRPVRGGDRFELLGRPVEVLEVPGHTRAHIAYYLPPLQRETAGENGGGPELFCGDTLFVGGCGRLFEGSPAQMHRSLQLLAALPEATRVWCAHEYTAGNLRWAAAVRPDDAAVAERLREVLDLRAAGRFTVPSTIGRERRSNLFVKAADEAELAELRAHKDHWRG